MDLVENTDTSSNGDLLHSATDEKKRFIVGPLLFIPPRMSKQVSYICTKIKPC